MKPPAQGQRGITLIEVLVALVMTGLVVGVAFHLFGGAIKGHARAERLTMALLVAESRLAEVGVTVKLQPGTRNGRTKGGYRWKTEVRPLNRKSAIGTTPVRAFQVLVSVTAEGDDRPVTLETIRLRPRGRDE